MTKLCVKEPFQESTCPDIDNPHSNTKIDTNRTKLGFYHSRYFIRGIKMHLTDCCSSVNEVLSNEELLIEILLRLPVISILLFKSVSKRWLSLITSPYFTLRRNQNPNIDPPSGLFLEIQNYYIEYDFVPLDRANSSLLHITFPFGSDKSNVEILQSCNGLLLCFIRPYKLFVYNPSTNQFMLPGQLYSKLIKVIKGVKLAFDPTKSPHYKVVQARAYDDVDVVEPYVKIVSYSSETYSWSVYDERFPANCFLDFDRGVYWNGGINWLGCGGLHYKLDVNHLVLTTIEKPRTVDGKMYYDYKLFESRGCLILVCISCIDYEKCIDSRQVNVYEMMNECSEWSVKYVIDFGDIMTLFPKTWEMPRQLFNVRCIVVGEREEDSFLVLEVFGKVVLYKMVLKTLCKIYDFSLPVLQPFRFHCFPFIPSLAGV